MLECSDLRFWRWQVEKSGFLGWDTSYIREWDVSGMLRGIFFKFRNQIEKVWPLSGEEGKAEEVIVPNCSKEFVDCSMHVLLEWVWSLNILACWDLNIFWFWWFGMSWWCSETTKRHQKYPWIGHSPPVTVALLFFFLSHRLNSSLFISNISVGYQFKNTSIYVTICTGLQQFLNV